MGYRELPTKQVCKSHSAFIEHAIYRSVSDWPCISPGSSSIYEGWNFNSDNYLFTTDTK